MRAQFRLHLVTVLAGVLLAPTLFVSPHLIEHEFDHGNHHSNGHSSPLCAWFCAAGQAIDIFLDPTDAQLADAEVLDSNYPLPRWDVPPSHPFTRGPPSEG